ncbi:MAG: polysaccharide deacetylase family protein [Spirochaetaceae bacterium]|nr:polysaccharide deacetylase family protein [Spirochaetaceae bacterium]
MVIAALGSCAGAPDTLAHEKRALTGVVKKVKTSDRNIPKYFVLDEHGAPTVKAALWEEARGTETGLAEFEVRYDLAAATADHRGSFTVPFTVKRRAAGIETIEAVEARDVLVWTPPKAPQADGAGILLAFDDDYREVWARYFGFFDRYGAKVTFFVQGGFSDVRLFCAEALARGHDVGYHTLTHQNLTTVPEAVFFTETGAEVRAFRDNGVPLTSFAYPFGLSKAWMHRELLKSFTVLRGYGVTFRLYHRHAVRTGYISSKALDNILFKEDAAFEKEVRDSLLAAAFIGGAVVLPLTTHTISDTADWGITPGRLAYLFETAAGLGLRFYRYCDL